MSFVGKNRATELWGKIKATFGARIKVSGATISLENLADTPVILSQATIPNATTSTPGVMSAADKSKLNGVAQNANNYTHPSFAAHGSGLYKITVDANGHVTAVTAVTKADITALGIPAQDTNTTYSVATQSANGLMPAADKKKLDGIDATISQAIAAASMGHAVYKGAVSANTDISNAAYKQGWYWVVKKAGTYVGEGCEEGDMIFCNTDKGSAYSAAHFDVVQNNMQEMTSSELAAILV